MIATAAFALLILYAVIQAFFLLRRETKVDPFSHYILLAAAGLLLAVTIDRSVRIRFDLPRPGRTTVAVFDLAGRRVRVALDRGLAAGPHELYWNGSSESGSPVASGVYFIRVDSGDLHGAEKVLLLR